MDNTLRPYIVYTSYSDDTYTNVVDQQVLARWDDIISYLNFDINMPWAMVKITEPAVFDWFGSQVSYSQTLAIDTGVSFVRVGIIYLEGAE